MLNETFPVFNLEAAEGDNAAVIGGFFCWDSEKAQIVDLGPDYEHALGVKLNDTESSTSVILIRPEVTLQKLTALVKMIEAAYSIRELDQAVPAEHDVVPTTTGIPGGVPMSDEAAEAQAVALVPTEFELAPTEAEFDAAFGTVVCEADEPEAEGTLLSNEVICEMIQQMGKLRKRIEELEAESTDSESLKALVVWEVERQSVDKDSLQRLVENEVEKQMDEFDFRRVVKDVVDDMDLTDGEAFSEAVKSIIDDQDLDSDEVETIVNDMDLTDKVRETIRDLMR